MTWSQSEPPVSQVSTSETISESETVKNFFKGAETYQTLFGKPTIFCVNKNVFHQVVGYMIQKNLLPIRSDEELSQVSIWGVIFDVADINSEHYLTGIHNDGSVKRVGI